MITVIKQGGTTEVRKNGKTVSHTRDSDKSKVSKSKSSSNAGSYELENDMGNFTDNRGSAYVDRNFTPPNKNSAINTGLAHPIGGNVNDVYGIGYSYLDKYGLSHVVDDPDDAFKYSGDGNVQTYTGRYGGGYALDGGGNRFAVDMPGVKPYGNDLRDGQQTVFSGMGLNSYYDPVQIQYKNLPAGSIYGDPGFNDFSTKLKGYDYTQPIPYGDSPSLVPNVKPAEPSGTASPYSVKEDMSLLAIGINPYGLSPEDKAYALSAARERGLIRD